MSARPRSRVDALVIELSVRYFMTVPEAEVVRLVESSVNVSEFVDALLEHGGRSGGDVPAHFRQRLVDLVDEWVLDPRGRGAASGLPMHEGAPTGH